MNKNERYERFLKAYAEANPLLSKPIQQKNAKKLWCEIKDDSEKYDEMMRNFKLKETQSKAKSLEKWANFWSKPAANPVEAPKPSTSQTQPEKIDENPEKNDENPEKIDENPVKNDENIGKRFVFI